MTNDKWNHAAAQNSRVARARRTRRSDATGGRVSAGLRLVCGARAALTRSSVASGVSARRGPAPQAASDTNVRRYGVRICRRARPPLSAETTVGRQAPRIKNATSPNLAPVSKPVASGLCARRSRSAEARVGHSRSDATAWWTCGLAGRPIPRKGVWFQALSHLSLVICHSRRRRRVFARADQLGEVFAREPAARPAEV